MSENLERAGRKLRSAREAADDALEAARLVVLAEIANGVTESEAARTLGVDRMTIRKWVGKR